MVVWTPKPQTLVKPAPSRPSSPRRAAANMFPAPSSSIWTLPQSMRSALVPIANSSTLKC
ncbi:hypothetical protein EMPG_12200 [Blastomyces silverae]|uniref:Uncharacterized protein n=1 Tax=Blastomyces silverae TaxID=2060906 RepID=A0A0H1BP78_9EURO|nr:hypothetical protein EMPG_12200 [Blastomyces silverae]